MDIRDESTYISPKKVPRRSAPRVWGRIAAYAARGLLSSAAAAAGALAGSLIVADGGGKTLRRAVSYLGHIFSSEGRRQ